MSDDLTIIHLNEIFHDATQLAKLHEIQRDRLAERAITAGNRPPGMRLSCPDPIRRVKGALDDFYRLTLDRGLAERGYMIEDLAEVGLFHGTYAPLSGKPYEAQYTIRWHQHGVTALDFLASEVEATDLPISIKSKDPKAKRIEDCKPSSENIAQERRMLALGGFPAGSAFQIWMGDPGTLRLVGPFCYELEQHHIDEARGELTAVDDAYRHFASFTQPSVEPEWNDPEWWRGLGLESTTNAFYYKPADAAAAIEARVRAERRAVAAARAAKSDADALTDRIYQFVDEQLAAAAAAGEPVKAITAYAGEKLVSYGRKSNGAKHIVEREDTAA